MTHRTSSDPAILEALASGRLTVDAARGHVYRSGRLVNGADNGHGYLRVNLDNRTCLIHRVVWMSAHGRIPAGMEINHRNGVRHDNRLANLEVVTHAQNLRHAKGMAALADDDRFWDMDPEFIAKAREAASTAHTTPEQWAELKAMLAP